MNEKDLQFSDATRTKAARLIVAGKVRRVAGQRDLWEVVGDHGTYRVRYDKAFEDTGEIGFLTCTCPLREHHTGLISYCSHALAVLNVVAIARLIGV